MKLYANNRLLAEQLLETAFGILRNEGLQPADCLAISYHQLADGIDVTPARHAAMQDCLRGLLAACDAQPPPGPVGAT